MGNATEPCLELDNFGLDRRHPRRQPGGRICAHLDLDPHPRRATGQL